MKKEFLKESNRIKSLFGYKRGVVVSEQRFIVTEGFDSTKYSCMNTTWPKGTEEFDYGSGNKLEYVQGQGTTEVKINGLNYTLDSIKFFENGKFRVGNVSGDFSCGANKKIVINGVEITPAEQQSNNSSTIKTLPNVTVYSIPKTLKANVGNKTGVQAFQDWLDINHKGWHKKYGTLGSDAKKGYGKFGPNTSAAWGQFVKEYKEYLKTNNQSPNGTENLTNQTQTNNQDTNNTQISQTPASPTTTLK